MFAQELSYYKLIKKLGAGGMGEVYLAEDTRLNRKVALKTLPENISQDRKQLSRFLREASLAANLNHPNICIIYEVNGATDTPFIAMEYIEGETLFDKIQSGSLTLPEILEIAVQTADALDEAHEQGIIHRDIKAANIIINRRGAVKILDFGLAKTIVEEVSDEAVTRAKTEAGILVGTVRYMSPEQALGKPLDGRTDLWSLGVLLYEMLSGDTPFKGETQVATFDEILHKDPAPLTEINEYIPLELEKIVFKLLEKDREFRYQTASDLRADLKRLQRNTGEISLHTAAKPSQENINHQTGFVKVQTDDRLKQKTTGATFFENKRSVWINILGGVLLLGVLAGLGAAAYTFLWKKPSTTLFEKRETQKITNLGKVLDALISADGKYLVYVQDEGETQSLWVKQIATNSTVQIVPSSNVVYQGLTVSSDSSWVYYNVWDRKSVGEIFRVPILGGVSQKVIHDCMPGITVSPDNQQIAFIRSYDKEKRHDLIIANVENQSEQYIKSNEKVIKSSDWNSSVYAFMWSPDGQSLAVITSKQNDKKEWLNYLIELSIADGSEKIIWQVPTKIRDLDSGLVWKPDKSGILITIAEASDPYSQIWEISYPSGEARQLTKDFNSYGRLSITADGKSVASVQMDVTAGLWILPVDNPMQAQKITNGKLEGMGASWTPDGRVLYNSTVGGNIDVWLANADGSNKKQLTSDAYTESNPCLMADGKTIAFTSNRNNNNWNLWLMNADGTNQRQALFEGYQSQVVCSKVNNTLYFYGSMKGQDGFWKMPEGSDLKFLWNKSPFRPDLSPDEKRLTYTIWNPETKKLDQEIYTIETGKTEKIDLPPTAIGEGGKEPAARWTPDGKDVSFLNEEKTDTNIWVKSLSNGKLRKVSNFNENRIYGYNWSPDGKKLMVVRGIVSTDVILIKELK